MKTLIGLYDDLEAAQQAMLDLSSEGFDRRHLSTDTRAGSDIAAHVQVTIGDDRIQQASKLLWQNGPVDVRREEGELPVQEMVVDRGEDGSVGKSRPTAD